MRRPKVRLVRGRRHVNVMQEVRQVGASVL